MGSGSPEALKEGVVAQLSLSKKGGTPLTCISLSGDQRHGIVGGRELMKVIRLTPEGIAEIATLKKRNSHKKGVSGQVSMYDMSWCPSGGRVAASLSSGEIATWDLGHLSHDPTDARGSGDGTILGCHALGAYRLSWNSHDHAQLLSGSQDGLLKMWDIRHKSEAAVFRPKNGSARDLQFSPRADFKFAAVFDNGKLQIWDYRYIEQPFMKVNISIKTTLAVEWHPTIPWRIATGSHDRMVKIWDLDESTGQRNRVPPIKGYRSSSAAASAAAAAAAASMEQTLTPFATINCPAPVSRVKWRPGHENQIAVTLDAQMRGSYAAIMVHDVTDPWVPPVVVHGGGNLKTGFCWLDTPSMPLSPSMQQQQQQQQQLSSMSSSPSSATSLTSSHFSAGADTGASNALGGLSTSSSGVWVGGRGGHSEGWGGMGVWQHMVSCSEQGVVSVHSLPRSIQPRLRLGPCAFHACARGEIMASTHKVDHDPASWSIYLNEDTQAAPGMFRVDAPVRTYPPRLPKQTLRKVEERRRSPARGAITGGSTGSCSGGGGIGNASMLSLQQQQPVQEQQQQQQQLAQPLPPQSPLSQQQQQHHHHQQQQPQLQYNQYHYQYHNPFHPPKHTQHHHPLKQQQHQQQQQQQYSMAPSGVVTQAQRIARSLSAGDQAMLATKGRRPGAVGASSFPVSYQAWGDSSLSRSPKQMLRGQTTSAAVIPPLVLGTVRGATVRDVAPNQHRSRGNAHQADNRPSRGRLTMFPVPDMPVALDKARWRHTLATSIWVPGPRSTISGGHMDPGPQLTEMLATSYILRGYHVRDMCSHNADVCLALGLPEMAYTWHQIRTVLSGIPGGVPVPLGHAKPPDLLLALAFGGRGREARGANADAEEGGGEGLEDGVGDGGEATIPMPEVLEKLIKSDAEAHHQHQYKHKQHKQRKEQMESQRVHRAQAAVAVSETSDGNNNSSGSEFPAALAPQLSSSLSSSSTLSFSKRSISRRRRPLLGPGGAAAAATEEERVAGNSGVEAAETTTVVDLWQDLSAVQSSRAVGGSGSSRGGDGCRQRQRGNRGRLRSDELVLPHWAPEVAEIARHRVEAGDVFDAVAICEVVRSWYLDTGPGRAEDMSEPLKGVDEVIGIKERGEGCWLSTSIPKMEVREWYIECLDLLHRYQLFGPETDLILHSDDPYISQIHQKNTTSYARCSECGSSPSSGTMCAKCRKPAAVCPVCDCTVNGHYVGCQGCNHYGHYEHMKEWFDAEEVCPHDKCDHVCVPRNSEDTFEFHQYY